MKLVDLVAFFRQGGAFDDFCKANGLSAESEVIEIYAQEPVSLESQLGFFPIEETEGRVEFQSGALNYHNLFDFFYFLEVINDVKGSESADNEELAQTLFSYAMKDA